MWITIDRDRCVGAGQCVLAAGSVFDQDEHDGLVWLRAVTVAPPAVEWVREAVGLCPARALALHGDVAVS